MGQWDVSFETVAPDTPADAEDLADDLVGILKPEAGVVSLIDEMLVVSVTIDAPGYAAAVKRAAARIVAAFDRLKPARKPRIVGVEARSAAAARAWIDRPTYPPMVGVAEVGEILGVSKQRVAELREAGRLPEPISVLRSGPVWPRPAIERFVEGWTRKPGRPRKTVAASAKRDGARTRGRGVPVKRARVAKRSD
jgi:hypothetical protein